MGLYSSHNYVNLRFPRFENSQAKWGKPKSKESEKQMLDLLKSLRKEESGQDLIEYALIGLLVALGAISGMGKLAASINKEFTKIASSLT